MLSYAGVRQGEGMDLEAFSSVDRTRETITLNKAVYVTTVDGELVFESGGSSIRRRLGQ